MVNKNSNFHAIETLSIPTNEVVSLGLVKRYEIFATSPIAYSSICCTVIITSLVHFKDIVLSLLVPKSYIDTKKKRGNTSIINGKWVLIF